MSEAEGPQKWEMQEQLRQMNEALLISSVRQHELIEQARNAELALRKSEAEFQQMSEKLDEEVGLRTAELLSINEQLQGFTYSVAHDLRQQIRGISTNATILMLEASEKLEPADLHVLNRLVGSAKMLAMLVDDLLAYSRLGKQDPIKKTFDLSALTEEVAEFLKEEGACPISTQFRIAPDLTAHGDPLMIRLVVENLLENACKYSSTNAHPLIEFDRLGEDFVVRDNGIGFDMQYRDKLFQPFERLHGNGTYSGTGIGLANVKRIVEKHGGHVRAEGKPGQGAAFYFSLA